MQPEVNQSLHAFHYPEMGLRSEAASLADHSHKQAATDMVAAADALKALATQPAPLADAALAELEQQHAEWMAGKGLLDVDIAVQAYEQKLPGLLARVRAAEARNLQAFQDATCLAAMEETLGAYLNNEEPSLDEVKGFALERAMRQIKQRTFLRPLEAVKGGQPNV